MGVTERIASKRLDLLQPVAAACGNDLERFLSELALGTQVDTWDPRADRISLLTLHAAKGLEFPVVFIVGCEDGLLPLAWGQRSQQDLDEERRLFYVGMTRAKTRLYLCHAHHRLWRGRCAKQWRPHRFWPTWRKAFLTGNVSSLKTPGQKNRTYNSGFSDRRNPMPQPTTKSSLILLLILVLLSATTLAMAQEAVRPSETEKRNETLEAPNPAGAMLLDGFLLRPLGLVATVLGTAAFIATLPFSLPTRSADDAAEVLVVKPATYTFARPLGEVEP